MLLHCLAVLISMTSLIATKTFQGQNTVIIGGGIQGISLAYYLTQRGEKCTLIERSGVASAASGKAGGFLAREWGSGPTVQLHHQSFDLHEQLAAELGIESFRRIPVLSVSGTRKAVKNPVSWLDGKAIAEPMDGAFAQVTPKEFCDKLWAAAVRGGAEFIKGVAKDIMFDGNTVCSVELEGGEVVDTHRFVLAAGPWSGHLAEKFFSMSMPMTGIKSTSLVYEKNKVVQEEPAAAFCDEDINGCHLELYPRSDGSVYICGCGGSDYVDNDRMMPGGDCAAPELIKPDPCRVTAASSSFQGLSSLGRRAPDQTQACMRPCLQDALPAMGRVPGIDNAFISCGHNCWGILWGPISGKVMSELLMDGKASIDMSAFDPGRFTQTSQSRKGKRGRKMGTKDIGEQW